MLRRTLHIACIIVKVACSSEGGREERFERKERSTYFRSDKIDSYIIINKEQL